MTIAHFFPAGKAISQLVLLSDGHSVFVDAIYPFNQTRTPPRLLVLNYGDAKEFCRRLVDAVHQARPQMVVSDSTRIAINVVANGYHIQIGDMNDLV